MQNSKTKAEPVSSFPLESRKASRARRRRYRRLAFAGITMAACGLLVILYVPFFYLRSYLTGRELLRRATEQQQVRNQQALYRTAAFRPGELIGKMSIPNLGLEVPIEEGVSDQELAVGAGHLPTSALPGFGGTSVLAAHNVTWFHNLDKVYVGEHIIVGTPYGTYTFAVQSKKVVHTGTVEPNSSRPSLILEACYPLNALYLTPYRYLVIADLVGQSSEVHKAELSYENPFRISVPKSIQEQGITLQSNSLGMGGLSYSGSPSRAFTQSNAPLQASDLLVQLFLAWEHANADGNEEIANQLGGFVSNDPFVGIPLSEYHYVSSFDVNLNASGNRLISLDGSVTFRIIHTFKVNISAVNDGGTIKVIQTNVTEQ